MFDTVISGPQLDGWAPSDWEQQIRRLTDRVRESEERICKLRASQIQDLRELAELEADLATGAATMTEWVRANLDTSPQTAGRMMRIARADHPDIDDQMSAGKYGVDRADLLCRLRGLHGPEEVITDSSEYSLGHLYGLVDQLRRVDRATERFTAENRYLVIQPSLDDAGYKFWGFAPAADGQVIEMALNRRAGQLPALPHQGQGARRVDALVSICMDSLTDNNHTTSDRAVTVAEVFVDARLAASSYGEAGSKVSSGPRVGPGALSEILCGGKVRVITQGEDGRPIGVSDMGDAIPPAVRSYVLHRDQGRCVIEGCRSRYRLQPHHLVERRVGGDHDPDNLTTLCWYHHHVAIHMLGMTIDPDSPPHRRRLRGWLNHDPPDPAPPSQRIVSAIKAPPNTRSPS